MSKPESRERASTILPEYGVDRIGYYKLVDGEKFRPITSGDSERLEVLSPGHVLRRRKKWINLSVPLPEPNPFACLTGNNS